MTYDANGNLTSDGTSSYTWDHANRLLSHGGHSYAYDGDGRRISQTVSSVVTKYLLDIQPGLSVVLSQTVDDTDTTHYVHGPRGLHAVYDGDDWQYPVTDGLGSVRGYIDPTGGVLSTVHYGEWGVPSTGIVGPAFTGEWRDANALQHHRARYYAPWLAVWTALDPWEGLHERPMSLNGYSWVEGRVVNATDASGKTPLLLIGAVAPVALTIPIVGAIFSFAVTAGIQQIVKEAWCSHNPKALTCLDPRNHPSTLMDHLCVPSIKAIFSTLLNILPGDETRGFRDDPASNLLSVLFGYFEQGHPAPALPYFPDYPHIVSPPHQPPIIRPDFPGPGADPGPGFLPDILKDWRFWIFLQALLNAAVEYAGESQKRRRYPGGCRSLENDTAIGNTAHTQIQLWFTGEYPDSAFEYRIPDAGRNGGPGRADLVLFDEGKQLGNGVFSGIYEIKPEGVVRSEDALRAARAQRDRYIVHFPKSLRGGEAKAGVYWAPQILPIEAWQHDQSQELVVSSYYNTLPDSNGLVFYWCRRRGSGDPFIPIDIQIGDVR